MATSKRGQRGRQRPYHHGNLRRALLDEAEATIRAEGVEALTLREIGARVGVSRSALYRHFADKGALLRAVAAEGFGALREKLVDAWEGGGRNEGAFRAMGVAYISYALANPSHFRVMFGGFVDAAERDEELAGEAAGAFQALVDALAALQDDGIVRADDTLLLARYVWSVVHGVAVLGMDGQLREAGAVEELTDYAIGRLVTSISRDGGRPARLER